MMVGANRLLAAVFSCAAAFGALLALPAGAQQEDPAPQTESTEPGSAEGSEDDLDDLFGQEADTAAPESDEGSLDLIEDLLEEGDQVMESVFVYSGDGRRDPFRSLLVVNQEIRPIDGPRPEGIPGLLIDELTLTGVWMYTDEPVAQMQSPDQAVSYLLRIGDKLYDGEVTDIRFTREDGGVVAFRQIVQDPTAPKPYRDVVRRLEP